MPQNTHLEIICAEAERLPERPAEAATELEGLGAKAAELAGTLTPLLGLHSSRFFARRGKSLKAALQPLLAELDAPLQRGSISDDLRWLRDNARLLNTALQDTAEMIKSLKPTPHIRTPLGSTVPRIVAVAEGFLAAVQYRFDEQAFASYIDALQETTVLKSDELWALVPCLKLVLLEKIAARSHRLLMDPGRVYGVGICIRSLHDVGQTSWKEVLEPLILINRVLREDPVRAYSAMDFESRARYRNAIANVASQSGLSEMDVAIEALSLARNASNQAYVNPRLAARRSHIGYYLVDEGTPVLHLKTGFRATPTQKLESFLRRHANAYYLFGIQLVTLITLSAVLVGMVGVPSSFGAILFAIFALLLPCSQTAVELMNYLTTSLLPPQVLPKLNFSDGIPDNCVTLVAVPALLLNEAQVCRLAEDLEVRYLGNRDRNLHFALLTDLADSKGPAQEDDPLVDFCAGLIRKLNEKYAGQGMGSFLLLHRHRIYDPREGLWMGYERKRGKLLDLNKLLRQQYDSFPVKVGDLALLPRVRFVITLDCDTELPRGSAQRMVGTLAHPLNRAIIDPGKNIVVAGYGILQPRVAVSVQSAARSRLANIYSGQTGLDIYTRAVSDVYQDLYGEAIFTGKGIYEVDALLQVLDHRFPRNALLSHDLLEGAYARAALASDIEVIDDYPSHYSAHNRRKHRWLRGDWQIVEWLLRRVPDETGNRVPNPISLISRWKILDNLRRSLVEPATFLLFLLGWWLLPGSPLRWSAAAVLLLFAPAWCQCGFALLRAAGTRKRAIAWDGLSALFAANINVLLRLTFLVHQTLLSLDAIVRALVRRVFTRRGLLEWETAAEAELETRRRTLVDRYLDWTPLLAIASTLFVLLERPSTLVAATPILLLWTCSKLISTWLNRPAGVSRHEMSPADRLLLCRTALRTWRYFAEFSNDEHNWLIPDNVQEEPASVAARLSPTNLGLLLNARQVACEFGYLTVPEFTQLTSHTLATVENLPKYRGHLFNWYDTRTLVPLPPLFISSADSGNLVAALWALQQGCLERLRQPLLQPRLIEGFVDHLLVLDDLGSSGGRLSSLMERHAGRKDRLQRLLDLPARLVDQLNRCAENSDPKSDLRWFSDQALTRWKSVGQTIGLYCPWLLPEFSSLRDNPVLDLKSLREELPLEQLPEFIDALAARVELAISRASTDQQAAYRNLKAMLPEARENTARLIDDLRRIAADAGQFASDMDFRLLLNWKRKQLSVGFNVDSQQLHPACYDLLASEARMALFVAVANEEISQEAWFLLGRAHTLDRGRPVLLSWTGTMFEYLMPALWMRTYPNTLLERSRVEAVRSQRAYAARKRIPWGISESAYFNLDEAGNYQYRAFGLPQLALHKDELEALVVSPYSTMLALHVDAPASLRNLRRMADEGWLGSYGFYEAADYTAAPRSARRPRYELVRCWMAHHQGMSLLAAGNFFHHNMVQRWFHNNPRVQATELLLQEKPLAHVWSVRPQQGAAAA